ncbi:Ger(x)C family spore germination protein [Cohnella nanjingensis]|uniref:Ger(X)C family spore germination protein n=1 Tax=Cohnella nanjingensis TaxID=1387779 RepID=A0A7X0RSX9_9BACL|nr:Ger(x)C family spore germination protein [Cohnella nanjingensis]MBB6672936.1 Ger(x)C family spore germination protein [Cohnella nanjingensis]
MNPIRIVGIASAALATLSLTGCWDSSDIEKNRYVSAIAFDYADHRHTMFAQMLDFSYVAKQEKGKSESPPVTYVGKGVGATVNMAANHLYQTAQQKTLWSHITSIVVTEAALKEGVQGFEDAYDRFYDTRFSQWIYGTRDNIETLFTTPDLFNMSSISTILHEPISNYKQRSWIKPIRWLHFFADILEPGKTVVLPTLSVNQSQWKKNREAEPKLQVSGAFLISGKTVKGWLSNDQLIGLRWMNPGTERTPLPIMDGGRVIGVLSLGSPKVKMRETFVKGLPRYRIKLSVKGNIVEMNDAATEQEMKRLAKSLIRKEIRETFLHAVALKADIYQLDYSTYVHHYDRWKRIEKQGNVHLTKDSLESIDVDIKLMHSGMLRTYVLE